MGKLKSETPFQSTDHTKIVHGLTTETLTVATMDFKQGIMQYIQK